MRDAPLTERRIHVRNRFLQHVLMEQPKSTPYHGTEEGRTYPELDFVPAYPWLGQQEQGRRPLSATHAIRDSGPMLDEGFGPQNYDSEVGRLGSVVNDAMHQSPPPRSRLRHRDDPAVDHDFELSESSRTCVCILSVMMQLILEPGVTYSCPKRTRILSRSHFRSVPHGKTVELNVGVPRVGEVEDVGQEEGQLGRASKEALGNPLNRVRSSRSCIPKLRQHS